MRIVFLRGGVTALLVAALLPAGAGAETIRVIQGTNVYQVRALHDVVQYDLVSSVGDPGSLTPVAADLDSPYDTASGSLRDGGLHFYKLDELGRNVVDFYGYASVFQASAAAALSAPDTARVFLHFDDTTGALSLVVVLDQPNDGDGGQSNWTFEGLPPTAFWAVEDDPTSDVYTMDTVNGVATGSWTWSPCCTDGGAISGLEGYDLSIRVTPTFSVSGGGTITALEFLTGTGQSIDDFDPIALDITQPFTVEISKDDLPASFEALLTVLKNLPQEAPRLAWADLDRVSPTVDPASRIFSARQCVVADGFTPGLVQVEPRDASGVLLGTGLDVVADDSVLAPGTLVGTTKDLHDGLYSQEVVSDQVGAAMLGFQVEGLALSGSADLLFVYSRPEATIELLSSPPFHTGDNVCFRASVVGGEGILTARWDLDEDGIWEKVGLVACHPYSEEGDHQVYLEVADEQPCYDRAARTIEVEPR